MADETPKKQFTEKEIVEAQANKVAAENGLKKAHPDSDISAEDIKKYLSKLKTEQKIATNEFLQGKEQLSFDMMFSNEPEKVEPVKTVLEKFIESIGPVKFENVKIVTSEPVKSVIEQDIKKPTTIIEEVVNSEKVMIISAKGQKDIVIDISSLPDEKIVFTPLEKSVEPKGVKYDPDMPEMAASRKVWADITESTANKAAERELAMKSNSGEWVPETDKSFTLPVEKPITSVVESRNGDPELKALLAGGLNNKFESGLIVRDNFVIYETPADFIDSIPEQTRTIFAKYNESGTSSYVTLNRSDKDQIRADYPELESWVTTKQNVKENDFDTNYADSNTKLVDRLETMLHTKSLDKVDTNARKKDIENELSEVRNLEKSGFSADEIDDMPESNLSDEPEKPATKKAAKLKNK